MGKEYCDYYNPEWVNKYGNLTYYNYKTEIIGNTFYIKAKVEDTRKFHEKLINNPPFKEWQTVVILVMCNMKEETIKDVLRSYNFNCKYEWLKEIKE